MEHETEPIRFSPRLFAGLSPREGGPAPGELPAPALPAYPPAINTTGDSSSRTAPQLPTPVGLLSPITATFVRASRGLAAAPLPLLPAHHKAMSPGGKALVWEPTGVSLFDLPDASAHPPPVVITASGSRRYLPVADGRPQLGAAVNVGGVQLALFRYRDEPIVVSALCPHQRGELHLGDIEEMGERLCVTCPRHHYAFDVSTGECASPVGRPEYKIQSFYARVVGARGLVEVGLSKLEPTAFAGGASCVDF